MAKKRKGTSRWAAMRKKAKERVKERKDKKGGLTTLNLPKGLELFKIEKSGTITFNLVPYVVKTETHPEGCEPGEEWFRTKFSVHRNIGAEEQAYVCLKTWGKRCPYCEQYGVLKKEYGWDHDLTKAMKASDRELYLVEDPKSGELKLWDISCHLFGKSFDEEIEDSDESDPFPGDPSENGASLKVRFKEDTWAGNKFYTASKIEFVPRGEPLDEELLEKAAEIDLDSLPIRHSYDKLNAIYLEQDTGENGKDEEDEDEDEGEEDEEETPRRRKPKSKRRKPEPEEDEDEDEGEEDDDEDEDEDEETPPPKKKSKPKKKAPPPEEEEDEDEDEDEEEDEDEDEAPPPKKRKPKKKAPEPEEDDDEDEDETPPPKKRKKGKKSKNKCPHGGTFGEDCDTLDECDDCDLWDECSEAHEE